MGGVVSLDARYVEGERAKRLPVAEAEATTVLVEYLLMPCLGSERASLLLPQLREIG